MLFKKVHCQFFGKQSVKHGSSQYIELSPPFTDPRTNNDRLISGSISREAKMEYVKSLCGEKKSKETQRDGRKCEAGEVVAGGKMAKTALIDDKKTECSCSYF